MVLSDHRGLTYPVIIMRTGGLDGVALQAREYRHLLNNIDINVHVMTGRCETKFSTVNPIGHKQTTISRLDFYHNDSLALFANQFTEGPETEESDTVLSDDEWVALFEEHRKKLVKSIDKILSNLEGNTPVLVYNLVSLRHAHPAAALALRDLILKYPDRPFISHSADPDAERPEKIARIKPFVLELISSKMNEPYSGGPYSFDNLYHIVLNPTQRDNFINKYAIPENHVLEIPDFLDFVSKTPIIRSYPKRIFMDYLADRAVITSKKKYKYVRGNANKEIIYFLSPVRPVYRKRLKEAMLIASQYGKLRDLDVAFVVTHPNTDDKQYFLETLKFAEALGLSYFHLGEDFTLNTLDTVYENLAALKTVGVIASSAGGWENALNEMARACIPFFMDSKLNSFKPLTEEIGIRTMGMDFGEITKLLETPAEQLRDAELFDEPAIAQAIEWIDSLMDEENRQQLIEHNYRKAYNYLSHEVTTERLVKAINYIYERHTEHKTVKSSTLSKIVHV